HRAGVVEAALDLLRVHHAADLRDRPVGLELRTAHRVRPVLPGVDRRAARDTARDPAAVPAGRPVAGDLALEHDDPQVGLVLRQLARRPEPGDPAADDRPVVLRVAGKPGPGRQRSLDAVQPQAARPVPSLVSLHAHRRDATGAISTGRTPAARTPAG